METREGRHGDGRVWQNRNFINIYEPGSVFKIFTAASLLRHGAIDTVMAFDCTNSEIGDGIRIENDEGHAYGNLPFMPAFARSSNIYFARAVANLRKEELYNDLLSLRIRAGHGCALSRHLGGHPASARFLVGAVQAHPGHRSGGGRHARCNWGWPSAPWPTGAPFSRRV